MNFVKRLKELMEGAMPRKTIIPLDPPAIRHILKRSQSVLNLTNAHWLFAGQVI